jgi:hypothetical protein
MFFKLHNNTDKERKEILSKVVKVALGHDDPIHQHMKQQKSIFNPQPLAPPRRSTAPLKRPQSRPFHILHIMDQDSNAHFMNEGLPAIREVAQPKKAVLREPSYTLRRARSGRLVGVLDSDELVESLNDSPSPSTKGSPWKSCKVTAAIVSSDEDINIDLSDLALANSSSIDGLGSLRIAEYSIPQKPVPKAEEQHRGRSRRPSDLPQAFRHQPVRLCTRIPFSSPERTSNRDRRRSPSPRSWPERTSVTIEQDYDTISPSTSRRKKPIRIPAYICEPTVGISRAETLDSFSVRAARRERERAAEATGLQHRSTSGYSLDGPGLSRSNAIRKSSKQEANDFGLPTSPGLSRSNAVRKLSRYEAKKFSGRDSKR